MEFGTLGGQERTATDFNNRQQVVAGYVST